MKPGEIWASNSWIFIILEEVKAPPGVIKPYFLMFEQSKLTFEWGRLVRKFEPPEGCELTTLENCRYIKTTMGTIDLFYHIIKNLFVHS
jgi:hypothetical protein